MSTTGVASSASIGPTRSRFPAISLSVTRCNPSGLGRSGERVAKTPVSGLLASERGCTFSTLRRARCSQVMMMISSPALKPSRHFAANGWISSQASGAPSEACLGASLRCFRDERITPTARSCARSPDFGLALFAKRLVFLLGIEPSLSPWSRLAFSTRIIGGTKTPPQADVQAAADCGE